MTNSTGTIALELGEWTSRTGQHRRYVNNWTELAGLDVVRYKSGNVSSAALNGERISNSAACRLLALKVWLDDDDAVHVDHWRGGAERHVITPERIAELVTATRCAE